MTVTGPTPRPARSAIRLLAALATLLASLTHGAALDWSGTVLVPANDGTPGGELIIRPPVGAQLPRVSVRLAGEELRMLRGSASEVRLQLPARTLSGPLVMTNLDTRQSGTLAPSYRVGVATTQAPAANPFAAGGSFGGAIMTGDPGMYLQISAAGQDVPVTLGEDSTGGAIGPYDVSQWLQCVDFDAALETGQTGPHGSSQSTGTRVWRPARFVIPVGKSTPFLFNAARSNARVDLTLHMFGRHHETGVVEPQLQYRIEQGRIVQIRLVGAYHPSGLARYVELFVIPNVTTIESITGGTSVTDDWASNNAP